MGRQLLGKKNIKFWILNIRETELLDLLNSHRLPIMSQLCWQWDQRKVGGRRRQVLGWRFWECREGLMAHYPFPSSSFTLLRPCSPREKPGKEDENDC